MSVLVLGGAGYIGSHAVYQLIDQQSDVVVIDNLQTGHREAVHPDATFYEGDIRDIAFMRSVLRRNPLTPSSTLQLIHLSVNQWKNHLSTLIIMSMGHRFYCK